MGVIIYSSNLNISPKMSYGVLECDIVMLQNYMLMICNKKGHYLCWTCILGFRISFADQLRFLMHWFKNVYICLGQEAQWVGVSSLHQKDAGSILGRGKFRRQLISVSLTSLSFSLSLSLSQKSI